MLKEALNKFVESEHGQKAIKALQEKAGLSPADAKAAAGACSGADCSGSDPVSAFATGKLTELVAQKTGMSKESADKVANVVSPYVSKYVRDHLGMPSSGGGTQSAPERESGTRESGIV